MLCLDLGCGRTKPPGYWGVDLSEHPGVDQVYNLDHMPWPWADASVDAVRFSRCVIHMKDVPGAFREVQRILKPGGLFWIVSGHPSHPETYVPEHTIPGLTLAGLVTLTKQGPGGLPDHWHGQYTLESVRLDVDATWKYPWTKVAQWFARQRPYGYEQWFSWMAPIRTLEWKGRKRA
jgi:ubiquinone/menaquinone biosynthesis C-methylase UbiE